MLRIAVPNKGSLSGPAAEMLHEAGYRQRKDPKELVLADLVLAIVGVLTARPLEETAT